MGGYHFERYFFGHSKPMYVLPVRWSTNPNERPKSGNLDPIILLPGVDYNNIEAKFQLSFKTKVLQGVFGVMVIYGGLYQKSHWQIYNNNLSRPLEKLIMNPNLF
jgi:phospholipase A1